MVSHAGARLGVRLLGHLTVEFDGAPLVLASQRSTAPLLVYLLLHRGAPVARDFLAFLFSPDDSEESARSRLRNSQYRLTKSLPEVGSTPWVLTDAETVRWNPAAELWLDIDDFVALSNDLSRLDEAVTLYRGDLLEAFYDDWLSEPRERLRTIYLSSLAELVAGHRRDRNLLRARGYATQLLAADPFREDVLRRLMAIRQESGDRAGALEEYRRFVQHLRDEMKIDPMPETVALRDAIARDEALVAESDSAESPPAQADARELPFVGRRMEVERLLDAWTRAVRRRGGGALIGGPVGIGKSRLALEFARLAEDRGARYLSGSTGSPEEMPYQCLIEALRSALPTVASLRVGDVWLATVATLLPELREWATIAEPPRVGAADERSRLFEALAQVFAALAKQRPLLVVLEDLQWAGETTLAALEYLLRRASQTQLLFIVTYRDDETPVVHPLRRLRRRATSEGVVARISLAPLKRVEVEELARRLPAVEPRVDALCAASDGNPLLLTQLVDVPDDELAAGVARGIRPFVEARYARCSDEAHVVAEIAALMGTRFSRDAVVEAIGWRDDRVASALDELIDQRIVVETGGRGLFDYSFVHDAVTELIASAAPPDRAKGRHRRIARVLEDLGSNRRGSLSATIARHYERAGEPASAAPHYLSAARRSLEIGAVDEAQTLATRGLAVDVPVRVEMLQILETVAARRGANADRSRALDQLDLIAAALGDEELGRDVALRRVQFTEDTGDREQEALALAGLRASVARGGDERWMGRLQVAETRHAIALGRLDDAQIAAEKGLAAFVAAGDKYGEAQARTDIAEIATLRGDLGKAEPLLAAARTAAARASDAELTLRLGRMWFQYAYARRDLAGCVDVARAYLEAALASGDRRAEADAHDKMAVALMAYGGRFADARRHLLEAGTISAEIDDQPRLMRVVLSRAQLALKLGDFVAARQAYEKAYKLAKARPERRWQVVAVLSLSGCVALCGDGPGAVELAREGLKMAREGGYLVLEASALEQLAGAYIECGDHLTAIDLMERALVARAKTESSAWTDVSLTNLAIQYAAVGEKSKARACVDRMLSNEETIGSGVAWPQTCHWAAAQVLRLCGDEAGARVALNRARELLEDSLQRIDESERHFHLAIRWHADIIEADDRGIWPDPPR